MRLRTVFGITKSTRSSKNSVDQNGTLASSADHGVTFRTHPDLFQPDATARGLSPSSSQPRSDVFQPDAVARGLTSSSAQPRFDFFQTDTTAQGMSHSSSQSRPDLFQPDAVARGLTSPDWPPSLSTVVVG